MAKLKTKDEVIERYWAEYLMYCTRSHESELRRQYNLVHNPTLDGFWKWYITDGPMGLRHKGQFYNDDHVEYA